jgi:hypothetical protein
MSAMMGDDGLTETLIEGSIDLKHPIWQKAGSPQADASHPGAAGSTCTGLSRRNAHDGYEEVDDQLA